MNGIRLNKFLAECGIASRRGAEVFIADGRVTINGQTVTTPAIVVTETDKVSVDGIPVAVKNAVKLWAYHKPIGQICTHHDPEGRITVFQAIPASLGRVISVGRLDINSEGLLLLTNNGDLARQLEHPSHAFKRTYRVRVFGKPREAQLYAIRQGVTIDGMHYRAADIEIEPSSSGRNCWLKMTLQEGKNREIRRILEHFGLSVNRLIRIDYAGIALDTLKPGELRDVSDAIPRLLPD